MNIDDLKPAPYNPRKLNEKAAEGLRESIKRFGDISGITWNKVTGHLVSGHQRVDQLKALGATFHDGAFHLDGKTFPVRVTEMTLEEEKLANLSANNPFVGGEFDLAKMEDIHLALDFTDMQPLNLDELFTDLGLMEPTVIDPDGEGSVGAPPAQPTTKPGDLYTLGKHRLLCGDSANPQDVQKLLNGSIPVLCVTDPPYGVNYDPSWRDGADLGVGERSKGKVMNDDIIDWGAVFSLWQPKVIYCWHAGKFSATVSDSLTNNGYEIISQIIWAKQHFVLSRGDYHWQHEPCWYAVKEGENHNWQGARDQATIWNIKNNNSFGNGEKEETWGHGTQKPVDCMLRPILNNSSKSDLICDPFLGSGTTLIAAEKSGRTCYGMELDPGYCDVIVQRWEKLTGQKAKLENLPQ